MKNKYKIISFVTLLLVLLSVTINNEATNQINQTQSFKDDIFAKSSGSSFDKFIVGVPSGPYEIDPLMAWDSATYNVIDQVCEGLFWLNFSAPDSEYIPVLAASEGTWSSDGLNYTVPLRTGVLFHDGTKFNSTAVKFTFDRLLYFTNATGTLPFSTQVAIIDTLYEFSNGIPIINRVEIVDEYTVKFVLNERYGAFKGLLTFEPSFIVSPESTPTLDYINMTSEILVGTGPFVYDNYTYDVEINFHAFENYWRGPANFAEMQFIVIQDSLARQNALLSGDIHFLDGISTYMIPTLKSSSNVTVIDKGKTEARLDYLVMNNNHINKTWRQAISNSINYTYIIKELQQDNVAQLTSPLPEGTLYSSSTLKNAIFNITKARKLVQSMGFGTGLSLDNDAEWVNVAQGSTPFASWNYSYNIGNSFREDLGILLQDSLAKIGIKVVDDGLEWFEFLMKVYGFGPYGYDTLHMAWMAWVLDFNDPSQVFNNLLLSSAQYNNAQVNDPYLDTLIELALEEHDSILRRSIYNDIQEYVVEDLIPWVLGYSPKLYNAHHVNITGYLQNAFKRNFFYTINGDFTEPEPEPEVNTIFIDDADLLYDWNKTESENDWCTGSGTLENPYIIQDLIIDCDGNSGGIIIQNSAAYFRIENCSVTNSGLIDALDAGLKLINVSNGVLTQNNISRNIAMGIVTENCLNINISKNVIYKNYYGLFLLRTNYSSIRDNEVGENSYYGIGIDRSEHNEVLNNTCINDGAAGIIVAAANNQIHENEMFGCGLILHGYFIHSYTPADADTTNLINGKPYYFYTHETGLTPADFANAGEIQLYNCTDSVISGFNISDGSVAVYAISCYNIEIVNNTFSDMYIGIYLQGTSYSLVADNILIGNDNCIGLLDYSDNNLVIENQIISSNTGLTLWSSSFNVIQKNSIENSQTTGINVEWGSNNNTVYQNNFLNNTNHAYDWGDDNSWDNGTIGNYWDDYEGLDANDDGIGDTSYFIEGTGNYDNFPIWDDGPGVPSQDSWKLSPFAIDETGAGDYTWSEAAAEEWCSGSGTQSDPYVIENVFIDGGGTDYCLSIRNSFVYFVLKNCTFINANNGVDLNIVVFGTLQEGNYSNNFNSGVNLYGCAGILFIDNIIQNNDFTGLNLYNTNSSSFVNNQINYNLQIGINSMQSYGNNYSGNIMRDNAMAALSIQGRFNTFSNNLMYGTGLLIFPDSMEYYTTEDVDPTNLFNNKPVYFYANEIGLGNDDFVNAGQILLYNCSNSIISNISLHDAVIGVYMVNCNNNIIQYNIISNGLIGIYLIGSNYIEIYNNNITGQYNGAIYLSRSNFTTIANNNIEHGQIGITISESSDGVISENRIINNDQGMNVYASNFLIYLNSFIQNTQHAVDYGTNNWDNGTIGNYWDDYTGADYDDDGIGDTPYLIEGYPGGVDNFPIWDDGAEPPGPSFWMLTPFIIDDEGYGDYTWAEAAAEEWCSGSGTWKDPYIIENVLMDCNGSETGIYIRNSDVYFILKNCTVFNAGEGYYYGDGIRLENVRNGALLENNCSFNSYSGIDLIMSSNISIQYNIVDENGFVGINSYNSNYTQYIGNVLRNNDLAGLYVHGQHNTFSSNLMYGSGFLLFPDVIQYYTTADVETSNLFNEKPIYFYSNEIGLGSTDFLNAGQILLYNCNDSLIFDLHFINASIGVYMVNCHNSVIQNCSMTDGIVGIYLVQSNDIEVISNYITDQYNGGIFIDGCNFTSIAYNTLKNNAYSAITIYTSSNGYIAHNEITNNLQGLRLDHCHFISIVNNILDHNNYTTIECFGGDNIFIIDNVISNSQRGLYIDSSDSFVFLNEFIQNDLHAENYAMNINWDNGTIGNYWDDYTGSDYDDDGIGDSPYMIPGNPEAFDNFPIWDDGPGGPDDNPPTTTITLDGIMGDNDWYVSEVLITLNATDALSGVDFIEYSNDSINWITYTGPFTVSLEGSSTIYYRATDNNGNIEDYSVEVFKIDLSEPSTTLILNGTLGNNGWYIANFTFALIASDNIAGVYKTEFSFDGVHWVEFIDELNWSAYIGPLSIYPDGVYTLYYRSIDYAGNVETINTENIYIDRTPTSTWIYDIIGVWGDNGWYISDVDLNLTAGDNLSGVNFTEYSFDGANWTLFTSSFTISDEGTTTIYYRSVDNAGNIESVNDFSVHIDKSNPTSSAQLDGVLGNNDWYLSPVTVDINATDGISGVDFIQYSYDGINWITYSGTFLITTEGVNTLYYRAIDKAGLIEPSQMVTMKIEITPPVTVALLQGNLSSYGWRNSDVIVSMEVNESISGLLYTEYSYDLITWNLYATPFIVSDEGIHIIRYRSVSVAGLIETYDAVLIRIDKHAPNTTVSLTGTMINDNWYLGNLQITLTSTDNLSGVIETQYSLDGINWITYTGPFIIPETGEVTLYYRSIDLADNIEPMKSIIFRILTLPIIIDDLGYGDFTWEEAADGGLCSGTGTLSDPYIIEDFILSEYIGWFLEVRNSIAYFIVRNCSDAFNIYLENVTNGIISNNIFGGVYLADCGNIMIRDNILETGRFDMSFTNHSMFTGNIFNQAESESILLTECYYNEFSNNVFIGMGYGEAIRAEGPNNYNIFTNNTISNFGIGLFMENYCDYNIISQNNIFDHVHSGIFLDACDFNMITDNVIYSIECYNNPEWGDIAPYAGLTLFDSDYNIVINNQISVCDGNGINLLVSNHPYCTNNSIIGNLISNCGLNGIFLRDCLFTTITDNTIVELSSPFWYYGSIKMLNTNNTLILRNNCSTNSGNGIYLANCDNNLISENTFQDVYRGIQVDGPAKYNDITYNQFVRNVDGIYLVDVDNYIIKYNNFIANRDQSIQIYTANNINISKNDFYGSGEVLFIVYMNNSIVSDNIFFGDDTIITSAVITFQDCKYNEISGNLIYGNVGDGIRFESGNEFNVIVNNTITDSYWGVYMEDCTYNTVSYNNISYNYEAGIFLSGSNNNFISNNILDSNSVIAPSYNLRAGIQLYYSQRNTIVNNIITNTHIGIELTESSDNYISNNIIENNWRSGIHFITSNFNEIKNNNISLNEDFEIHLEANCNNNLISGNNIEGNNMGIYLDTSFNNTLKANIVNAIEAIGIYDSYYNLIRGNVIYQNDGYGIVLDVSHYNEVVDNSITFNNGNGISVFDSYSNLITGNEVLNNTELGISISGDSDGNIVFNNIIAENTLGNGLDDSDYGLSNSWYQKETGNYWGDYDGVDENNDGIGDTPYYIPGTAGSIDYYPLWDHVIYVWNSTWGLREFQDWGTGVALDSAGNFYIAGTTENLKHTYDICVVKLNSEGVVLWYRTWGSSATINNPYAIERGTGIALDSSGNIYITGYTEYGWQMFLLKYDSVGNLLWNLTRSGQSYAITIDSSDNIYIAGTHLVKYNSEGVEQWSQSCPRGRGIALDSFENIYVVGATSSWDATLVKYDSSGMLLWSRTWGQSMLDYGAAIVIDSLDNIYITGETTNILTSQYDIFLIKYTSLGVQLWDHIWGCSSDFDYALGIILDSYGNIYLGGYTYNFGAIMADFLLVKFDSSGSYQWNRTWGGNSEQRANAIAMDSSGDIYLVGYKSYYMYTGVWGYVADFCIVKFYVPPLPLLDPVKYKWHSTWGLKEYQDWGNAMVLDSAGNIYVVGTTLDQLNYQERGYDICLVKFDSSGVIQWNRTWGGTISEEGMGIALDSNENVYIVGFTQGSQMVLLKYDSSGVLQWNLTRSGGYFYAITIDSSDNIFITGTLGHDLGLWKYDTTGVEQWVRTWGGPIYGVPEHGRGITLDSSGNIYIVGDTRSFGAGSYDACLLKYDSSGVLQWYRTWGENRWDRGNAISVDSYDNIYITGFTTISEVNDANDAFLVKYSRSGVQIWNRTWGGFYTDIMYAITLDSSGYIYLAGRLGISYGKSHVYLVIYDRMGEQRWNRTWGDKYYDHASAIALDSSGDIYLAGSTSDYIDIPVGNQYVYDMLLMKYDCNLPPPPPDTSPPATAIVFSGTPGLNDWFVSEVSVALTADANSGVDYTEYGFDGTNWFLYTEPFLITIEGETTIYYRSVDNAGHVESTRKRILKIDYTPPVTAIELNGTLEMNEWFSSDVLVTLSATDEISGFDHSEYSYDGINWHLYSGPFVISLEGDITVYYRSTDIAGNTEIAQSVNFKIVRLPSKIVEEVITILENLEVPSEAQSDINKAIYDLNRAIIKFENGKFYQAFFKIQYALEHLMCAEINGADVQEPIDILVSLVQGFADDGIEDAIEMVGEDNEFVIRALEKYDIALQKLSNEKYDKAVKYFRLAFKNAMKARVKWIPESFIDDLMDRIADIQELKEGEEISSCALDCLNSAENKIYAAITKANNSAFALSFYKLSDAICFLLEAQDYGVETNFLINSIMSNINDMVYLKISDAESVLVGADSGLIETAWTKYYNAQNAWENGNYFTAIERYILALEKAEDALLPID